MGGPTTSVCVRSVKPTGRWSNTLARGFVSGCAPNTRCVGWAPGGFRPSTSTMYWDWSALLRGPTDFRVRTREPFSGSRMRLAAPVRFDERGVKTEHDGVSEAPATERAGNG